MFPFFSIGDDFNIRTGAIIVDFKKEMLQAYGFVLSMLRKTMTAYGVDVDIQYPSLRRYLPSPPSFNTCACSVALHCPDPSWSGGQFICQYGNNCTKGSVVWGVPGFVKACNDMGQTDFRY